MERGIGWLKREHRVATRYDKYAPSFLEFSVPSNGLDLAEITTLRNLALGEDKY